MSKEKAEKKSQKKYKFKVGDIAVYPAHGVGVIEAIEGRDINGELLDFYIIKVLENNIKIMVPIRNVDSVGLRNVIDPKEVSKVYDVVQNIKDFYVDHQTWNRRYREYMDKIKTGSIFDVAEVFRDIYLLRLTKILSFGERKFFDIANNLLLKELAIAKKTDEKTILSEIEAFFVDIAIKNEQAVHKDNIADSD